MLTNLMATYFHRLSDKVEVGNKNFGILLGGNRSSARRQSLDPKPGDSISNEAGSRSHSDRGATRE